MIPTAKRRKPVKHEEKLQLLVCKWLALQYPNVIFSCDLASGMPLSVGQAVKAAKMRSSKAYPDLFIAEAMGGYHGLYVELKKEGTKLHAVRTIGYATEHLAEQAAMLDRLKVKGYQALFAVGFAEAEHIIKDYLGHPCFR